MPSEPDVFKKLDALLNKHKNGDPASANAGVSDEHSIPTLTDAVEDDDAFPVLTEIFAAEVDEPVSEGLELDLEYIPEDVLEVIPESQLAAELPDVWEQNEDEFDSETTHGFGLSAFSREAESPELVEPDFREDGPSDEYSVTDFPVSPISTPPTPAITLEGEWGQYENYENMAAPNPDDAEEDAGTEAAPSIAAESADTFEQSVAPEPDSGISTGASDPISTPAPAHHTDEARAEAIARELTFTDALAERALRDLDRHIAKILEQQVGPQLARRLDDALASMLDQFSTNIESLLRDAVREEMRRYFDGDNQ